MSDRLVPCGTVHANASIAMVGKSKTPKTLAALMPSADVAAKVGVLSMGREDTRVVRRKVGEI